MKVKQVACMFKKIDVGKSDVIEIIKKATPFWVVITRIGKKRYGMYGVISKKSRKEGQC